MQQELADLDVADRQLRQQIDEEARRAARERAAAELEPVLEAIDHLCSTKLEPLFAKIRDIHGSGSGVTLPASYAMLRVAVYQFHGEMSRVGVDR